MRKASKTRETLETKIAVTVDLDNPNEVSIATGVGFFDHMLTAFARHGRIGLHVKADGDLHIDSHHTVEDVGIVLGQLVKEALGDKHSINRFGSSYVPMDESLGFVALDISGRPYLVFDASFKQERLGNFDTELVEEFMQAFAFQSAITLHAKIIHGSNSHHQIEALFKALGRALGEAVRINPEIQGVNSTKGYIE
ncbi:MULTISPECIES: imidazoleglycerol-phosphate dehydratase HisB [Gracilibacillus]|uniref:imidazoleglycerol-phosphate dehydratase HisB n=1 Tax=Gracilibacillus TaxID=74385 RepID=UPI000825C167|nr:MULTISPECIES: imidazoleglycerol-phosphate dehydratase HisB [Gracilibacillus]